MEFAVVLPSRRSESVDMPARHACALYLSSSAKSIAQAVALRASKVAGASVVDVFVDPDYARSSVKLVAERAPLLNAAAEAAAEALESVDLATQPQPAPHPRQGALDMVAFMPLSEASATELEAELAECDALAWSLGKSIGELGCPVLMYGARAGRSLLDTRRGTSFFKSVRGPCAPTTELPPDFGSLAADGALPPRWGLSVVGSMPYVTNFNLQVAGATIDEGRAAASALRKELGVQVMALPYGDDGVVEVGCNLQATAAMPSQPTDAVLECVRASLPAGASIAHSYVVGMRPAEALAAPDWQFD